MLNSPLTIYVTVSVKLYVTAAATLVVEMLMNLHFVACHQLGEFYQVVQRNHSKAEEIFHLNCADLNFHQSCFSLGNLHLTNKGKLIC